jgi:hypothetical protein
VSQRSANVNGHGCQQQQQQDKPVLAGERWVVACCSRKSRLLLLSVEPTLGNQPMLSFPFFLSFLLLVKTKDNNLQSVFTIFILQICVIGECAFAQKNKLRIATSAKGLIMLRGGGVIVP